MKTEDDSSDYVSAVPPVSASDPDPAASLRPSGAAADPESTAPQGPALTGPSNSPTKPSQSKRTVCDHCRRRRMCASVLALPSLSVYLSMSLLPIVTCASVVVHAQPCLLTN